MKIITWNCNMAFRKKAGMILKYKPDILIVPECEHPDKLNFSEGITEPKDCLWFGNNLNKGLGVFSYSPSRFKLLKTHDPKLRMVVPIAVNGGSFDFTLYAVWANNPDDPEGQYVGQVWKAIHHYDKHLDNKSIILAGDFNSNTIWDKPRRKGNHSDVVKRLEEKGICSAYHLYHRQEQGKEKHPTLYMYRHKDKSYHIDYCFVSADLAAKLRSVLIGGHKPWTRYSDHVPVMVTFGNQ
ncbi:MAG: endonuclease/exonuclease/phosphatase family protein [Bacteroidota bacterium]|nr:endonuclease/exonuclease/phosphatase family protein [Bacteroidota bacterium]